MTKSKESQIKTIRFDAERLHAIVKEDLSVEEMRQAAIEVVNRLAYELVTLGAQHDG